MVVIAGWIKITNSNVDGREVVLNFLGPGDTIGEMAILAPQGHGADAVAMSAVQLFMVHAHDLRPMLTSHPQVLLEIIQILGERLRTALEIIEDNSLDMRRRIARGLLRLALQHGSTSKQGIRVNLAVSQSELGGYFGLSRESVSRELGALEEANVIRKEGAQIVVIDESGLSRIADACWRRRWVS
jgi:CRP/FNR family transcriptional regulator, cyclic AMP receptor protein